MHRSGEIQGAWESVAVIAPETPFVVEEGAGAGQKLVVEETGRQRGDRSIDIHIVVVLSLRQRPCERIWRPCGARRKQCRSRRRWWRKNGTGTVRFIAAAVGLCRRFRRVCRRRG